MTDTGRAAPAALLMVAGLGCVTTALGADQVLSSTTVAAPSATGSVRGTVRVRKAYLNPNGSRHDTDVVLALEPVGKADVPAAGKHAAMDQKDLAFVPHVLAVQAGTTVDYLNGDAVEHNVSCPSACCAFDLGQAKHGVVKSHCFEKPGVAVLLCKLHPDMAAYVVVLPTPYFTTVTLATNVAEKKQSMEFAVDAVPPGTYTLTAWNKKLVAEARTVTVTAGAASTADVEIHKR